MKKKVIASNIKNLTDARYFAAQGVDYLLFDLSEISVADVIAFKEWISGPELLVVFDENSEEDIDEAMLKIEPAAIAHKSDNTRIEYLSTHYPIFNYSEADGHLSVTMGDDEYQDSWLDNVAGIIVQGSDETKVGFKSFDELDEIFDRIHE